MDVSSKSKLWVIAGLWHCTHQLPMLEIKQGGILSVLIELLCWKVAWLAAQFLWVLALRWNWLKLQSVVVFGLIFVLVAQWKKRWGFFQRLFLLAISKAYHRTAAQVLEVITDIKTFGVEARIRNLLFRKIKSHECVGKVKIVQLSRPVRRSEIQHEFVDG